MSGRISQKKNIRLKIRKRRDVAGEAPEAVQLTSLTGGAVQKLNPAPSRRVTSQAGREGG